jgi:hypothetical protein
VDVDEGFIVNAGAAPRGTPALHIRVGVHVPAAESSLPQERHTLWRSRGHGAYDALKKKAS